MMRRDSIFKLTMLLPLALLAGYFLVLVGSQSAFFSLDDFITQLGQQDIRSAIFLSLASADVSKSIAVIFVLVIIAVIALLAIRKIIGRRQQI